MTRVLLPLLLCLLLAAPAGGAEDVSRLPVPRDLREEGSEHWYGIYLSGRKVGWALRQLGPLDRGGERFLRSRQVTFMRTASRGEVTTTHIERRRIYDRQAPHALRRASAVTRRGDFRRAVHVEREGVRLSARIREADENERSVVIDGPLPTFADETTPAAWLRRRPPAGASLRYRHLDLGRLRVEQAQLRVTRAATVADAVTAGILRTAQGDEDRVRYDLQGAMLSTSMLGLLEVRREPRAQARALGEAVDALKLGETTIDKPLGTTERVRRMTVRVRGAGALSVPSGPGQTVAPEPASRSAVVRVDPRGAPPVRVGPAQRAAALAETPLYPVRHRVVQSLAREAVAEARGDRERVEALVGFVSEFVVDSHTESPLSALDVLARQRGDCNEHALLLVTLARAAGVPAREVYGLLYKNDRKRTFGRHAWCEVVIDGVWVPVDPFWNETTVSAARIRLGARGEGPDLGLALAGATFELLAIERDPPDPFVERDD